MCQSAHPSPLTRESACDVNINNNNKKKRTDCKHGKDEKLKIYWLIRFAVQKEIINKT